MSFDQIREADLAEVKRQFWLSGESISDWASRHGFSRATTYSLLAGRLRANRGEAHRIAVALGLKPAPTGDETLSTEGDQSMK